MSVIPDYNQQLLINNLISNMIKIGVWNSLDVFFMFAANAQQSGLLNWKNPSGTAATAVNSPTFTAYQGFAGDGSTSYVNTQWAPNVNGVNFSLNNASAFIYSRTNQAASTVRDFGANSTLNSIPTILSIVYTSSLLSGDINGTIPSGTISNSSSLELFGMERSSSANYIFLKNGSSLGTITSASVNMTSSNVYVGCTNNNGSAANFSSKQFSLWGAGSSGIQTVSFYNALNLYLTAIGANV
jgi:hypothetical protein